MGLSSHLSSKNPLSTLARALLFCRELQPLKGSEQSPGHPHASAAGTCLVFRVSGGVSGSTEQAGRDQGQGLWVAVSSPTAVIPLSPFSSCQSHPQPPHFQLRLWLYQLGGLCQCQLLHPCAPTRAGRLPHAHGHQRYVGNLHPECFPPSHGQTFAAMGTSARHHWQCHVLPLSCPGWLCSRRSLMASGLLLGQLRLSCWGMSWPV